MNQDAQWLGEYAERGSQEAFARLVDAHVGLVYSAAFRQLRDHQLAEDVTQRAFMALAQKAKSLRKDVIPAAWLLVTTRYLSTDMQRSAKRRAAREARAVQMRATSMTTPEPELWQDIEPLLNEALCSLSAADLYAITLRYHQAQNLEQVASALGVSSNTAAQRLHRALGRLRAYFERRGVTVDSVMLGSLILNYANYSPPAGLAASIVKSTLLFHAGTGAGAFAKGATMAIVSSKVKIISTAAVLLLTLGGTATVVYHVTRPLTRTVTIAPGMSTSSSVSPIVPWREWLNRVYCLQQGQDLLHSAALRTRTCLFFREVQHGSPSAGMIESEISNDSASVFTWDSQPNIQLESFQPFTVSGVIKTLTGLRTYDFDGLGALGNLRVPGDWVVRKSATSRQRMAAIEGILNQEFHSGVGFAPRTVEREVVIATGTLQVHTLPKAPFANVVDIYLSKRSGEPLSMAAGKPQDLLGDVGEMWGTRFIDESSSAGKSIYWRNFLRSKDVRWDSPSRDLLLTNLSEQLGLQFHVERRSVEVWFVQSATTKPSPVADIRSNSR